MMLTVEPIVNIAGLELTVYGASEAATVMAKQDIQLLAHLMRRAGFGATRDELETCVSDGYEATVERLLATSAPVAMSEYLIRRFHPNESSMMDGISGKYAWLYRIGQRILTRDLRKRSSSNG